MHFSEILHNLSCLFVTSSTKNGRGMELVHSNFGERGQGVQESNGRRGKHFISFGFSSKYRILAGVDIVTQGEIDLSIFKQCLSLLSL